MIRLEAEVAQLNKALTQTAAEVNEMDELLMQAKGARWAIIAGALVGGFIAAKLLLLPMVPKPVGRPGRACRLLDSIWNTFTPLYGCKAG